MAGEIVASNDLLKDRAERMRELFNVGHSLRLFSNDIKPLPGFNLNKFTEASYVGYNRKNMDGQWKPVFRVKDGEYQFSSVDLLFPGGGSPLLPVVGWFLVGSNKVKMSCRLPFPYFNGSGQSITVRVDCQTWATSVLCL